MNASATFSWPISDPPHAVLNDAEEEEEANNIGGN